MDGQTILGNHGAPFQVLFRGKAYPFKYRTQKMAAAMERACKEARRTELKAYRADCEELGILPELQQDFLDFMAECKSTDSEVNYSFGGKKCNAFMESLEGTYIYVKELLPEAAAELSEEDFQLLITECQGDIEDFGMMCNTEIEAIQKELGWDVASDKEKETLNPKVARRFPE